MGADFAWTQLDPLTVGHPAKGQCRAGGERDGADSLAVVERPIAAVVDGGPAVRGMSWTIPAKLAGSPSSRCWFSGRKKFQQDIGLMSGGAKWCG